jgi:hypothetical protein
MKNENQILLLCGPAVPDRRIIARLLCRIDTAFRYFEAKPIDQLWINGNGHAEEIDRIGNGAYDHGLIYYISRADVCYAIRRADIENCLSKRKTPVFEWQLGDLHYISSDLSAYSVLLLHEDREMMVDNLREKNVNLSEKEIVAYKLEYEEYLQMMSKADLVIRYNTNNLMHAVEKIQSEFKLVL